MKSSRINYVAVGTFVIAMGVGLVVSVALLTGRTGATDAYFALYRNVSGVKFGTQVVYEGYPIGQVEEVTPEEKDGRMWFRVDFSVREGWRIPSDSTARIAASGLLAAMAVNIDAGASPEPLKPGAQVTAGESANIFAVMSSVAAEVSELAQNSIRPLLATINDAMGTFGTLLESDGRALFGSLRDVADRVPAITNDIASFSANLNAATGDVRLLLTPENRDKVLQIIADMEAATTGIKEMTAAMNSLVGETRGDIGKSVTDVKFVVDSMARHVESVNQNLDGAARNMYEFSRLIRQNPGLLLGGSAPEDRAATKQKGD